MSAEYKRLIEGYQGTKEIAVIDCWRQIDADKTPKHLRVIGLGRNDDPNNESGDILAARGEAG
jgi:hypothetical protein